MIEREESSCDKNAKLSSRREFVKKSSALAVGGATWVSALNVTGAHVAGDDEIKIALIGCGGRGSQAAVQALNTEGKVTLWAMADAFSKRIDQSLGKIRRGLQKSNPNQSPSEIAEQVDVPPERQFAGLDAYQQAIDSGVDLVILTTPPGFRPRQFEAAINAGKHVFTEKPLGVDAPGIRRVLAAGKVAEEKGLAVGVGLQRRHDPAYMETIKRLQEGAIGDIPLTRVYWNGGGVWLRTRAEFAETYGHEPTEMGYQVNNWYYFNWLCGDNIVEQHIHNLDVGNWLKGTHPIEANGMGGREVRTGNQFGQIFDHHFVEFTYADGSTMLSQCRHQKGCWSRVDEFATGCAGTAHIGKQEITTPSGNWSYSGPKADAYQTEHDDLFAAIRSGTPYNEIEYGAHSTMTAIFGRMATYSGKVVKWDDAINSEIDLSPSVYDFASTPPVVPDAQGNYPVPVPGKTKVV
jgi:myo-inositol 2-dehydrogenase/D-chiro-inositol 1-dehydrogenase